MYKIDVSQRMYLSLKYIAKAIAAPNKIYFIDIYIPTNPLSKIHLF